MTSIGMKPIHWFGKCEADKITSGKYEVLDDEGGTYALVFDNTFSKQISKTASFVLVVYPTAHPPLLNTQAVNPQTAAVSVPNGNLTAPRPSPHLKPSAKDSADDLSRTTSQQSVSTLNGMNRPRTSSSSGQITTTYTGVLAKRRRKRHQGYAKRFFSLDYTSSTLSYYQHRNSSALRGAIPLSLAAITANTGTREISIDSGAEIWHLRASNPAEFKSWTAALEKATKLMIESRSPHNLNLDTGTPAARMSSSHDDQEWAQIEALIGRIAGIRDAVRRLAQHTENGLSVPVSAITDTASNASDAGGDDDQKSEERKSFWKRKASGANSSQGSFFGRRSVSAQGTSSASPTEGPTLRISKSRSQLRTLPEKPRKLLPPDPQERDMNSHCKELLHDLDTVVSDFSTLTAKYKLRRPPQPKSAGSRLSFQTTESEEFFDADDGGASAFLTIREDSDGTDEEAKAATDESELGSSSDFEDGDEYAYGSPALRPDSRSSAFPPKLKSLAPLPCKSVRRRATIPPPAIMPPSLIGFLRKNVGKDLSTISMPVSANEPLSLLQRAAEQLEYSELLDRAACATDSVERLIFTSAFAISSLSSNRVKERSIRKPFNPMLGETFELIREDKNFRFVAEKVSHRPVQLAFCAESPDWVFTQSPLPSQKFWGKSSEIITDGKARLRLHSSAETFSWSAATSFLRNIIAGEKYVEPVGSMTVLNETTGQKCIITFKAKGMFSGRSEDVTAQAFDAHGDELPLGLNGTWTSTLHLTEHGSTRSDKVIWTVGPLVDKPEKHYGMTRFATNLNEITEIEDGKLPSTDSRLRPDQIALENGDYESAETLKNQLEERQRARRKAMEEKGEKWTPRWFVPVSDSGDISSSPPSPGVGAVGGETIWRLKTGKDGYWEERNQGNWTGVPNVLGVSEAAGVSFAHQKR
ncbi:putative oxysterol binding protein [Phaeomoniella chlamydospora]|uniref:Putative oxysterol binding protein n=1 Tax=Phaeomoniella chlamydospora TaxID=158046 RepID=A0A0G2EXG4_PHACM|nr:putative oxysterol binding protein [Phaeomoniella chlamydospora]